jgi:hypothetical protein
LLERVENALLDDDALVEIYGEMLVGEGHWPDEMDDYRQWLAAGMLNEPFVWVLQQYGCPASILDITSDLDVAMFFTEAQMIDGRVLLTPPSGTRTIYVFIESIDSECFMSEARGIWQSLDNSGVGVPDRIRFQRCGYLKGASFLRQNQYANMIVARIHLKSVASLTTLRPKDLFPGRENDLLFETLGRTRPVPAGLY